MARQFSIIKSLELIESEIKALELKNSSNLDDRERLGQLRQCADSLGDCLYDRQYYTDEAEYNAQ